MPNEIKEDIVSIEKKQAWVRRACYIMKMTITEIKILLKVVKSRLDIANNQISHIQNAEKMKS